MLNRTNLSLTASSNGLNLGTRSLALVAGLNIGSTLRTVHAYPERRGDTPREGKDTKAMGGPSMIMRGSSPIAGSFPGSPQGSSRSEPGGPSEARFVFFEVEPVAVGNLVVGNDQPDPGRRHQPASQARQCVGSWPRSRATSIPVPARSAAAGG